MKKVAIVTDGSCDLPIDLVNKFKIIVAPFKVVFGTDVYYLYGDSGDITKEEFYKRLETSTEMPSTAIPPPKSIYESFEKGLKEADSILAIFLSKELSGTYQNAFTVAKMFEGSRH